MGDKFPVRRSMIRRGAFFARLSGSVFSIVSSRTYIFLSTVRRVPTLPCKPPANSSETEAQVTHFRPGMPLVRTEKKQRVRWEGSYTPLQSGKFLFLAVATERDVYRIVVNGREVIGQSRREGDVPKQVELELEKGK